MKETFGVQFTVSNLQKNTDPDRIRYECRSKMVRQLADHIVDATVKEDVGEYSTTYGCRVIVTDVDDFWRLVEKKAFELQRSISPTITWEK